MFSGDIRKMAMLLSIIKKKKKLILIVNANTMSSYIIEAFVHGSLYRALYT